MRREKRKRLSKAITAIQIGNASEGSDEHEGSSLGGVAWRFSVAATANQVRQKAADRCDLSGGEGGRYTSVRPSSLASVSV
jgi:hypothetical protein